MRFMWKEENFLSFQLIISIQWKLMNSLPIYSIGGQRFVCCAHNELVIRTHSNRKEEVIYFNQSLPTSNSIPIVFALLFKIKLKSQEKESERWNRWLWPHLHNYCSIKKFFPSLRVRNPNEKKIMKISSSLLDRRRRCCFYFLTLEERQFVC